MSLRHFLLTIVVLAICQIRVLYAAESPNHKEKKTTNHSTLPVGFFKCEAKLGKISPVHFFGVDELDVTEYFWISPDDTIIVVLTPSDDLSIARDYMVAKLNYNRLKPIHFKSKLKDFQYTLVGLKPIVASWLYSDIKYFAFGKIAAIKDKMQFLFHKDLTIQNDTKKLIHKVLVQPVSRMEFAWAIKQVADFQLESKGLKEHVEIFLQSDTLTEEVVKKIVGYWQKVDWDQTRKQTFTLNFKEDGTYSEDGQLVNFMTNGPGALVHTYGTGSYWINIRDGIPTITIHCTEATTKLLFRDVKFNYKDDKIISANDPTFFYSQEK